MKQNVRRGSKLRAVLLDLALSAMLVWDADKRAREAGMADWTLLVINSPSLVLLCVLRLDTTMTSC
jgi:hypothetical protein